MGKWNPLYEKNRKYNKEWEEIYPWLKEDTGGTSRKSAFCKVCKCNITPKRHCISTHGKSNKHQRNLSSTSKSQTQSPSNHEEEVVIEKSLSAVPQPQRLRVQLIKVVSRKPIIDDKAQSSKKSGRIDGERLSETVTSPASQDSSDDDLSTPSAARSRLSREKKKDNETLNLQNVTKTFVETQRKILESLTEIDKKLAHQNELVTIQTRLLAKMADVELVLDEGNI